jgi:hypothetical protein
MRYPVIYNTNIFTVIKRIYDKRKKIITDLTKVYSQTELNIYIEEYTKIFLEKFSQFQTLYNQDYLNIQRYNSYYLNQKIIDFIF